MDLMPLIAQIASQNASDLHLTVGLTPMARINGHLLPLSQERLQAADTEQLARSILSEAHWTRLVENGEVDASLSLPGKCRYRVNVFRQRGSYALALRVVQSSPPSFEALGLPVETMENFCGKTRGLILVTGPTGSGKSTTLAAMVDFINRTRDAHIITLEDPIEYVHRHNKCIVNQREIGSDSLSYAAALRAALREDPDVILIGEMRDLESISIALTAAETGHLVLSTLHTVSTSQTIDRIIDVFPPYQQQQVRVQLSMSLLGIVAQQLLPTANGQGRAVATEILVSVPAIRNMIRESKIPQIESVLQTSARLGMCTMDASIAGLYNRHIIDMNTAMTYAMEQDNMRRMMRGGPSY
nr:type IV pilus twitching motility protein PilT [Maliibacterium massiliense]